MKTKPQNRPRKSFRDSRQHKTNLLIRWAIRRLHHTKLFKGEKAVLLALFNHAMHHDGDTYAPGRELLAKRAGVSVRTVARAMDRLREMLVIRNVAYANGAHNRKTQFTIDWNALFALIGIKMTDAWLWMLGSAETLRSRCDIFLRAIVSVPLYKRTTAWRLSVAQASPWGEVGPPLERIPEHELPY
jgi:hypothetical protein